MTICLKFETRGTYRIRCEYSRCPWDRTVVVLIDRNKSRFHFKLLPTSDGTEVEFRIGGDGAKVLISHPYLTGALVVSAPGKFRIPGVITWPLWRLTKHKFADGHRLRVTKSGLVSYLPLVNRGIKEWHARIFEWLLRDSGLVTQLVLPAPARYRSANRKGFFAVFPTPETIRWLNESLAKEGCVWVAMTTAQKQECATMQALERLRVVIVDDKAELSQVLSEALKCGLFEGVEYLGLILDGMPDFGGNPKDISTGQQRLMEVFCRMRRESFFGSAQHIDDLVAVFERFPAVDRIACPVARLAQLYGFCGNIEQLTDDLGGDIWLRIGYHSRFGTAIVRSEHSIGGHSRAVVPDGCDQDLDGPSENGDLRYRKPSRQCSFTSGPADDPNTRLSPDVFSKMGFRGRLFVPGNVDLRDGEGSKLAGFRTIRPLGNPDGRKVALFVSFAPGGKMREHCYHYMMELRSLGFLVYALAANDRDDLEVVDPGPSVCDALGSRENIGYDFALWSAAIMDDRRILGAEELLLVNDSVIGPLVPLNPVFDSIGKSSADIVGMTDSDALRYHFQSYFLLLRRPVVSSRAFFEFISTIKSHKDKWAVISKYEASFLSRMAEVGFLTEALFSCSRLRLPSLENPSIQRWRELLAAGFPFLKGELIRCNPCRDDLSDMEAIVRRFGNQNYIARSFEHVRFRRPPVGAGGEAGADFAIPNTGCILCEYDAPRERRSGIWTGGISKAIPVAVVIPLYRSIPSELEVISLEQCCIVLGTHPMVFVCGEHLDLGPYQDICGRFGIEPLVERFESGCFSSVAAYNRLLYDRDFYARFTKYKYILVHQLDAFVFRDALEYWCEQGYDYLGAPWFERGSQSTAADPLIEWGGNGGLSLRRTEAFVAALTPPFPNAKVRTWAELWLKHRKRSLVAKAARLPRMIGKFHHKSNLYGNYISQPKMFEDGFFSFVVPRVFPEFKVAPAAMGMFFAFECQPRRLFELTKGELPFGCHAWERYDIDFWRPFMESFGHVMPPELIVSSPSMHLERIDHEVQESKD